MDKLQAHRDTYMCMYYMYVYIINYELRLLTFHLLQLVTYHDLWLIVACVLILCKLWHIKLATRWPMFRFSHPLTLKRVKNLVSCNNITAEWTLIVNQILLVSDMGAVLENSMENMHTDAYV